ncbi:MAG: GGDEF domain-containing protein [Pirellulaceae bacterium]
MSSELLAAYSACFRDGTLAALLLCAGLAIGVTIGKRHSSQGAADRAQLHRLIAMLTPLADWTHGLAADMAQFRSLLGGVSLLFRDAPQNDRQRLDTAGLLSQVVEANEQLQRRLNRAEHMLKEQTSEMSTYMSEARTDALTGLPNRRAFDEDLARRMAEWRRYRRPLSILMIDVDHFKKFNDAYGHQAGDEVLCQVAQLLRDTMRESDLVVRYGGEEMAVVLPATDIQEACRGAERARRAIEATQLHVEGQTLRVTVSVGTAQCHEADSSTDLVKRADEALYAAKRAGRNCGFWHDGCRCIPVAGEISPTGRPSLPEDQPREIAVDETFDAPASFARICQDLQSRLEQFTVAASGK